MQTDRPTFWEKIAREVSGNTNAENPDPQPDPGFEAELQQAARLWQNTARPDGEYEPDVNQGWQRFQLRVQTREMPAVPLRKVSGNWMWAVAATISLLLVAGAFFLARRTGETWTEIRTAAHETRVIQLPDGSRVSLNQNSTFAYPAGFQKENRTVRLKGEAFFEVAKAEGKRFTIFAEGTKTEVIGTSFNLRAYAGEPVKVQVVSGKVAFARTATEEAVFLVPGQEGVIGVEAGQLAARPAKQKIADQNFRAWKTKNFTFSNVPLSQMVATLEQHYQVNLELQTEALGRCRFTTSFRDPNLAEVLEILALTGNLTITRDGSRYLITGKGCE